MHDPKMLRGYRKPRIFITEFFAECKMEMEEAQKLHQISV
jgi:hypothetical protein